MRGQGGRGCPAVPLANAESVTNLPRHHVVAMRTRRIFLHVIARSEATWQSASPQRYLTSWLRFGQIRRWLGIRLRYCFSFCAPAGTRIATSRCSRPAPRNDRQRLGGLTLGKGGLPCKRGLLPTWQQARCIDRGFGNSPLRIPPRGIYRWSTRSRISWVRPWFQYWVPM